MSIQKLITEINRKVGALEIIEHIRVKRSISKNKDLLVGAFIVEGGFLEFKGVSGLEIEIKINRFLKYEKINSDIYRIYNQNINLLIRPLE
ncbi:MULTISPECIES: hypothetical protein [unclassified Romboutsia]|uniref:hypothetical protein n=1 Tax=unclassified Romboutsia TaxID=2626894 RepID=UPI000F061912|nr:MULTISPECIES: hypothetical protein [unclassified Romboutsia]